MNLVQALFQSRDCTNTLTLHVGNAALITTENHSVAGFVKLPDGNEGESELGANRTSVSLSFDSEFQFRTLTDKFLDALALKDWFFAVEISFGNGGEA
jgi:hypothetical protein